MGNCAGGCKRRTFGIQVVCAPCARSWLRLQGVPEPVVKIADIGWVQDNLLILGKALDRNTGVS